MKRYLSIFLVAIIAAAMAASYVSAGTTPSYAPCNSDSDCRPGSLCLSYQPGAVMVSLQKECRGVCFTNLDCEGGLFAECVGEIRAVGGSPARSGACFLRWGDWGHGAYCSGTGTKDCNADSFCFNNMCEKVCNLNSDCPYSVDEGQYRQFTCSTGRGTCSIYEVVTRPTLCNDHIDNDGDILIDLDDFGCFNTKNYDSEYNSVRAQCDDHIDNDGDLKIDYLGWNGKPRDTDCASITANPYPKCKDRVDNDGDGKMDYYPYLGKPTDPGCSGPSDNDEKNPFISPIAKVAAPSISLQTASTVSRISGFSTVIGDLFRTTGRFFLSLGN